MNTPTPDQIRAFRGEHGLTQAQAAKLVHVQERQWRRYEAGDWSMSIVRWELIHLKLGVQLPV
jgi:DNA-binding XRE family transcriptional regulator